MLDTEKEENKKTLPPLRMVLNSLSNVRKTYSRIIRRYKDGEITTEEAKTLTYMFSTLCQLFKTEKELNINERIEAIEKALNVSNN